MDFNTFNMIRFQTETEEELDLEVEIEGPYTLMLYNDDVNTFDHVIECLIKICKHSLEQAEQVAMIVHTKGKCDIKHGGIDELKPKCEALLDKGLSAKIEV